MAERTVDSPLRAALRDSAPVHAALLTAATVLCAIGILDLRVLALRHWTITRRPDDVATIPSANMIRLVTLGHREWAADLLWSSALLYFGETIATHQQQRYLQRYADTLEDVDPQFRQAYLWGATISVYNTRIIRRSSIEDAIHHLERGLREFPDDGEMTYQLGFDYYFELPRLMDNAEEQREAKRRGAEYLRRAAALGYGPPWMALAAAEALERVGLTDRALAELHDLYLRTTDPDARARIEQQIEALSQQRGSVDPFLETVRRMDAERQASFPYVPPLLYLFVGPPVPGIAHVHAPPPNPTPSPAAPSTP